MCLYEFSTVKIWCVRCRAFLPKLQLDKISHPILHFSNAFFGNPMSLLTSLRGIAHVEVDKVAVEIVFKFLFVVKLKNTCISNAFDLAELVLILALNLPASEWNLLPETLLQLELHVTLRHYFLRQLKFLKGISFCLKLVPTMFMGCLPLMTTVAGITCLSGGVRRHFRGE